MAYGEPILQIYTQDPDASDVGPIVSYTLTDDNRSPLGITYERIEQSSRMANGTMRRFVIANKKKISTSWDNVPAAGGTNFTSDGYLSGAFLKSFVEENIYNPVWIKLTYSAEAWRQANSISATNNWQSSNPSFKTTRDNTESINELAIDMIGHKKISSVGGVGVGVAFISTKVPHGITHGSSIFIKGADSPFVGTWKTVPLNEQDQLLINYDESIASDDPRLYLRLESTTITDSGVASAVLNNNGNIVSASGTSLVSGIFDNTVIAPASADFYTTVTSSALGRTLLFAPTTDNPSPGMTIEFLYYGTSNPTLSRNVDLIRKLPSNLVANHSFNSDLSGWTLESPSWTHAPNSADLSASVTDPIAIVGRDTVLGLAGRAAKNSLKVYPNSDFPFNGLVHYYGSGIFDRSSSVVYHVNAASVTYSNPSSMSVTPGQTYTLSGFLRWSVVQPYYVGNIPETITPIVKYSADPLTTGASFQARIIWKNSSGGIVSSSVGTLTSVTVETWNRVSASGVAPASATYADVKFIQSGISVGSINLDQVLFEQSSVVNDYVGWTVQRVANDRLKFEGYPYTNTGFRIYVDDVHDEEWHHIAFTTTTANNNLYAKAYVDGVLKGESRGTASYLNNEYPIKINHSTAAGRMDEIAIYNYVLRPSQIEDRQKSVRLLTDVFPDDKTLAFKFNDDGNAAFSIPITSYSYDDRDFVFKTDSTYFLDDSSDGSSARFRFNGFVPISGTNTFNNALMIMMNVEDETTFTAKMPYESGLSGKGSGYGGAINIVAKKSSTRYPKTPLAPVVGEAVQSDVIKAFITNFDYTINKRFTFTDYVDMSIEFTEI